MKNIGIIVNGRNISRAESEKSCEELNSSRRPVTEPGGHSPILSVWERRWHRGTKQAKCARAAFVGFSLGKARS